jgi:hypothetical protein
MAHLLNAHFDTQTTTKDWTALLEYLQERSGPAPNPKISSKLVTYTDGDQKNKNVKPTKGTAEYDDYNNCNTIMKALKDYRAKQGTLYLFIVNLDPAA